MIKLIPQSNSYDFRNKISDYSYNYEHLSKCGSAFQKYSKYELIEFANGEIAVKLHESVRNDIVVIVSQPKKYRDVFELLSTVDAARRSSAKEIIAVIPSLPHSRQERRNNGERTSISAKLLADMLQVAGVDRIVTMDVHTTAIEGFYNIPFENLYPTQKFIDEILQLGLKFPYLLAPDAGAIKRTGEYASILGYEMGFCSKNRKETNKVDSIELIGDVKGKDIIIVDDMIDTGGTLVKVCEVLKKRGANSINIFATHGIFSGEARANLYHTYSIVNLFVTNTIPQNFEHTDHDVFKEVDVSSIFYRTLDKIFSKN